MNSNDVYLARCGECATSIDQNAALREAWDNLLVPMREATRPERAYQGAIRRNLSAIDRLDDKQIRDVVKLLRQARLRVNAAINDAAGFNAFFLPEIENEVKRIFSEFSTQYKADFQRLQIVAQDLGTALVQEPLAKLGYNLNFNSLPSNITQTLANFNADQIVGIGDDAVRAITRELNLGMLGVEPDRGKVIKAISKYLPSPAGAGTITNRAKRIIRTEVNRIHSMSAQNRMEQSAEVIPGLRKYWLPTYLNTRPTHVAAGRNYSEARAILIDEPFIVGGVAMMYPRDPGARGKNAAREIVNCRCRHVPKVTEEGEE